MVTVKHRFFENKEEADRCYEKKSLKGQHPVMYSNASGSNTKKEYDGIKTSQLWQRTHQNRYFTTRPYVVLWFER